MIAVVSVLLALPIGYLVRDRTAAFVAFGLIWSWAFTFQSVYLLVDMVDGDRTAFTPGRFPWSYGVMSLAIGAVGLGLLLLGRRLARRRAVVAV